MSAVIAPSQHDLWITALSNNQAHSGFQIKLEAVLRTALEIILTRW
jgi:plasmid maintenance system killer protein